MKIFKLIFPYILSIATFLITYYIDPLKFTDKNAYASIPALIFSILILVICNMFDVKNYYDKSINYSDNTLKAVKEHLKVIKLGTPKESMEYIIDSLPSTREVLNTSFNFTSKSDRERAEEQFYNTEEYKNFINAIASFSKNGYWKDVGDNTAKPRFKEIKKLCNNNNYKFKTISDQAPRINFIVLLYKNNTKEVLFNWDYKTDANDPTVLSSIDDDIINMYINQHSVLWKNSSGDHDFK